MLYYRILEGTPLSYGNPLNDQSVAGHLGIRYETIKAKNGQDKLVKVRYNKAPGERRHLLHDAYMCVYIYIYIYIYVVYMYVIIYSQHSPTLPGSMAQSSAGRRSAAQHCKAPRRTARRGTAPHRAPIR